MADSPFDDAVDVVVLRAEGARAVPVSGTTPITLTGGGEPTGDLLAELLDSTVRVTAAEGVPPEVLDALRSIPVPPVFGCSPWLVDSHPIVVRDGTGRAGDLAVHYNDETGLRIDLPEQDG